MISPCQVTEEGMRQVAIIVISEDDFQVNCFYRILQFCLEEQLDPSLLSRQQGKRN